MSDLAKALAPKSDQINADDLIGSEMLVQIVGVKISLNDEQKITCRIADNAKVWRPCKTMGRVMHAAWGDETMWVGKWALLYRDPTVTFGPGETGGIRIKGLSDMKCDIVVPVTKKRGMRVATKIERLAMPPPPQQAANPAPPPASVAADAFTQDEARTAARRGTEAFKAWWAANPDKRADATLIKGELQQFCAAADNAASEADNPFGLPPIAPTQAEIDAAMAEAARATEEAE